MAFAPRFLSTIQITVNKTRHIFPLLAVGGWGEGEEDSVLQFSFVTHFSLPHPPHIPNAPLPHSPRYHLDGFSALSDQLWSSIILQPIAAGPRLFALDACLIWSP